MKIRSLIAFLKTLPQDSNVYLSGTSHFSIYYVKPKDQPQFISFDTEYFDHEEFQVSKRGLKVFDSLHVSTQFEEELARSERIDEALKQSNSILKSLDKNGGK